jgi:hypothetical protein
VLLRLGVLRVDPVYQNELVTVYAVDVRGPHDEHGFIRRLAEILTRHGVQPLDYDLDTDQVFNLTLHLVNTTQGIAHR